MIDIPPDHKKINSRALIIQHCKNINPLLLKNTKTNKYAVYCPQCKLTITGSTNTIVIDAWNDTMKEIHHDNYNT